MWGSKAELQWHPVNWFEPRKSGVAAHECAPRNDSFSAKLLHAAMSAYDPKQTLGESV